jgi:FMN phosphatase YigB (HAD superfamily)
MDKEALELQRQWTESRIKRINEEIERFKIQRKKLDALIEDDEKEILQLQESLKKNTEEYLVDKPYEAIEQFIKERGYTYSVEDVIDGYEQHKRKCYTSYTMSDCIKNLKKPLELIRNKV